MICNFETRRQGLYRLDKDPTTRQRDLTPQYQEAAGSPGNVAHVIVNMVRPQFKHMIGTRIVKGNSLPCCGSEHPGVVNSFQIPSTRRRCVGQLDEV